MKAILKSGRVVEGKIAQVFVNIGIAKPIEEIEIQEEIVEPAKPIEEVRPKRVYKKKDK